MWSVLPRRVDIDVIIRDALEEDVSVARRRLLDGVVGKRNGVYQLVDRRHVGEEVLRALRLTGFALLTSKLYSVGMQGEKLLNVLRVAGFADLTYFGALI